MSVIKKGRDARKADAAKPEPVVALTPEMRAAVLRIIGQGATIVELCALKGMPSVTSLWQAVDKDEAFRNEFRAAQAKGAAMVLQEAQELLRDAAEGTKVDTDKVRVAEMYARASQWYAEKFAPKEFGQLVKIAGDAELAAVQVSITKYVPTAPVEQADATSSRA